MNLNFEWNEDKANENLKKHKISFEEARTIFNDPFSITIIDQQDLNDKYRFIDIGYSSKGQLLVMAYTERGTNIRIISCRKATKQERTMKKKDYNKHELENNDMLPEYDFKGGIRGKHYKEYRQGHTVTVHKTDGTTVIKHYKLEDGAIFLDPDILEYFPDSESVNKTLKALIRLIPQKRHNI